MNKILENSKKWPPQGDLFKLIVLSNQQSTKQFSQSTYRHTILNCYCTTVGTPNCFEYFPVLYFVPCFASKLKYSKEQRNKEFKEQRVHIIWTIIILFYCWSFGLSYQN